MATLTRPTEADVRRALDVVIDPELDEPITDLGFVRSVSITGDRLEVHLRLPTSFCAPNFAYLMASDAKDALVDLAGGGEVVVELDDHTTRESSTGAWPPMPGIAARSSTRPTRTSRSCERCSAARRTRQPWSGA